MYVCMYVCRMYVRYILRTYIALCALNWEGTANPWDSRSQLHASGPAVFVYLQSVHK